MLEALGAFGPFRFESVFVDARVSYDVGVVDDEIVVGAGFEELLLDGQPVRFIEPQVDLGNLLADVVGFWGCLLYTS